VNELTFSFSSCCEEDLRDATELDAFFALRTEEDGRVLVVALVEEEEGWERDASWNTTKLMVDNAGPVVMVGTRRRPGAKSKKKLEQEPNKQSRGRDEHMASVRLTGNLWTQAGV